MTTTYEQQRVLHDEASLMLGAWQFAPEMKQVRDVDATVGTICGHHSPHAVRIFTRRRLDDVLYGLLAQESPFLPPSGRLAAADRIFR